MSVLDDLQQVERRVIDRLGELEPLVAEYEELQRVAERLGVDVSQVLAPRSPDRSKRSGGKPASAARKSGGHRSTGASRRRAQSAGGRQQDILRLIGASPGMTVTQIGRELNVDPTGLYRPVRKLVSEGVLSKQGAALHLAEADKTAAAEQ